ncbi:hypothetical protein Acr_03g0017250 [Actinidia rufa]|uniref:DUF2828 domain-containing protein n=1 Tax=Actinidia rufa TaxID=165716 RepID=A0A7J0EEP2_9ERIC|nr:hypothetical protein Acr_03g0017250 [Actinidia rufa]
MATSGNVRILGPPLHHRKTYFTAATTDPPSMVPCLNFFFKAIPNTPPQDLIGTLEKPWTDHPLSTLKLIFTIQKSNREGEERVLVNKAKVDVVKKEASELRRDKKIARARKACERYIGDPDYHVLHDGVSELFPDLLKSDMDFLNLGRGDEISLVAKWCPSIDSSYNKSTLICESIAKRVFQDE